MTSPRNATATAEAFYAECLRRLEESSIPFLVAGMFAVNAYTGLNRPIKDLDIFCKAGDYPRILAHFRTLGYEIDVHDERWISKIRKEELFVDVIFNSTGGIMPITDHWFVEARSACLYGRMVPLVSPTELIWSKAFVQSRSRYDGADIAHVILKQCEDVDWRRLLSYMEPYWEVLLVHVLNFRFIYPSERHRIPAWLLDELLKRLKAQADLPASQMKICRGSLLSRTDYETDVTEWGFADLIRAGKTSNER